MKTQYGQRNVRLGLPLIICCAILTYGCSDDYNIVGVGSPRPGVLRVFIKSDDTDNYLVIAGDTVRAVEGSGDSLSLFVGQGRAYRGSDYAVLYKSLQDYQEITKTYNPIRKKSGIYQTLLVFESNLPPANYDSLTFALSAASLQIGLYQIPLSPVQDAGGFVTFTQGFRIVDGGITTIYLQLKPFGSLTRVGDLYQYSWIFDSVQITYP